MKPKSVPGENRPFSGEAAVLFRTALLRAQQNQPLAAAQLFLEVTRLRPDCFEAYCQLGLLLRQLDQWDAALAALQQAVQLKPGFPKLNLLIGSLYKQQGRFEAAADCCRREIQLNPANADAHYNLGLVFQNLDRPKEAIAAYQTALGLRPDYVDALVNLGSVFQGKLDLAAASHFYEQAIRLEPQNPEPHWQLCTALLARGDFERGWREYEWRWQQRDFTTPQANYPQPLWNGADLCGRRILLHAEQGFGDIIQFVRYATLVSLRGGEVVIGCPPQLRSLLATVAGVAQVVTDRANLPSFDLHAPLMSLPAIFQTTLENLPRKIPYLTAPATGFDLAVEPGGRLNVGLVWAGDPAHKNDRRRSLPLELFRPWADWPGIRWHSLQAGSRAADLNQLNLAGKITNWGSRFRDFGDTARVISQLDLVISVDTAVAHLAGALGKPVWTLHPFAAEWRWMLEREDSPWYPTMRLFRQRAPGDWKGLLQRVTFELANFLAGCAGKPPAGS